MFSWNFGRRIWRLYSTDIVERVIQAGYVSLKQYSMFSMMGLMARYFNTTIDKSEQTGFDLESPLTEKHILYAALDLHYPRMIRNEQLVILERDGLLTTAKIENDAIGSFVDMHLAGQNMDDALWIKRLEAVEKRRIEELAIIDEYMIPVVGRRKPVHKPRGGELALKKYGARRLRDSHSAGDEQGAATT